MTDVDVDMGEVWSSGATSIPSAPSLDEHLSVDPAFWLDDRMEATDTTECGQECSTINLAVRRDARDRVDGFDETFHHCSDVDGGDRCRKTRRSFAFGRARVDLYRKHPDRILKGDPVVVIGPVSLLGLPIAVRRTPCLLLLAVPAWRNPHSGPAQVIADHAVQSAGVLPQLMAR